jgi:hypothetical protein
MIWKARNSMSWDEIETTHLALLQMIWHRLKLYLSNEWEDLLSLCKQNKISLEEAKKSFHRDFGYDNTVFAFDEKKLILPRMAPM